ncbi:MAG: nuclear transport factor 2 family protein [Betaproteobacteria bacterium]
MLALVVVLITIGQSHHAPPHVAGVLNAGLSASAATDPAAEVIELEKASWEAWKGRNAAFFESFLTDDHLEVGTSGVAGKSAVVASVRTPQCEVRRYALSGFRTAVINSETIALVYRAEQETTCFGKPVPSPAWATSIYVRRSGRWQNVLYQQTPTPQP